MARPVRVGPECQTLGPSVDEGQGRLGKGMRVLNNTKAHQIKINQKRMEMVVHCKESNRLITPKEKQKKTAAASLA